MHRVQRHWKLSPAAHPGLEVDKPGPMLKFQMEKKDLLLQAEAIDTHGSILPSKTLIRKSGALISAAKSLAVFPREFFKSRCAPASTKVAQASKLAQMIPFMSGVAPT